MYPRVTINEFLAAKDRGESVTSPRIKLTQALCTALPAKPYAYEILDAEIRPLRIRVRPSGHKSLEVSRKLNGRNCRSKVCTLGDLSFKDVRTTAQELLRDMIQGRSATVKRAQAKAQALQAATLSLSVQAAVTAYIDDTERAPATNSGYQAMLDKHLAPWHSKRLVDISSAMVVDLHRQIGGVAANNAMRLFRATWLANRRALDLPEPPTYILSSKERESSHTWAPEKRRDRRIHPAELQSWWEATDTLGALGRNYLRFTLMTGMRRREVSSLKWEAINWTRKTLTLTEADTKAGRELVLPLTDSMLAILHSRQSEARPFALRETKCIVSAVSERSGVPFSCHDLRRTFASIADEIGISMPVLKSLLNHSAKSNDVTLNYIGSINEARKRKALEQIEAFIFAAVGHENIALITCRGESSVGGNKS
jgi:integrase